MKWKHPLIDAKREKYGTMYAFEDKTGISRNTIYDFLKHRTKSMRDDTKMIIADALGLSYEQVWRLMYARTD